MLTNYPLWIEPSVMALEVKVECEDRVWQTLQRVAPVAAELPKVITDTPHLFGPNKDLSTCPFVVAYGTDGGVREIWYSRGKNYWDIHCVQEEVRGVCLQKPSLRYSFQDETTLTEFYKCLDRLAKTGGRGSSGIAAAKDLATILTGKGVVKCRYLVVCDEPESTEVA